MLSHVEFTIAFSLAAVGVSLVAYVVGYRFGHKSGWYLAQRTPCLWRYPGDV